MYMSIHSLHDMHYIIYNYACANKNIINIFKIIVIQLQVWCSGNLHIQKIS